MDRRLPRLQVRSRVGASLLSIAGLAVAGLAGCGNNATDSTDPTGSMKSNRGLQSLALQGLAPEDPPRHAAQRQEWGGPLGGRSSVARRLYIRIPKALLTEDMVKRTGWEQDHKRDDVFAFGYMRAGTLAELPQAFRKDVWILDPAVYNRHEFDPKTLEIKSWSPETQDAASGVVYHDTAALTRDLLDLAAAHPQSVELQKIGVSTEGRPIWAAILTNQERDDRDRPHVLLAANMHGDEVVGRELLLDLAHHLAQSRAQSPRVARLLDHLVIHIVPSLNPDGFERGDRYNARDVDLNRNFPDFTSDDHDTPGGREVETQAMMAWHDRHHFILAANFHGGEVCFNMPWDTKDNFRADQRFGDDPLMQRLARGYANANKTMRTNSGGSFDRGVTYGYEWYEVDGGLQDWSIHYRDSIHGTVELSYAKWPPAQQLPRYFEENRESLLSYLESALHGVHLKVVNGAGEPVGSPSIAVSSMNRTVRYRSHVIHRPTLPGAQTARITADGYQPQVITVNPAPFDGTLQTVVLTPGPTEL